MDQTIDLNTTGEGATVSFENGTAYTYISGKGYMKDGVDFPAYIILAHELAGHAIPTIAPPSALDARFDWNAVNAEYY